MPLWLKNLNGLFVLSPGSSGAGQDELSQLGRKGSLDASHPQTDEEFPPLQGGVLQKSTSPASTSLISPEGSFS